MRAVALIQARIGSTRLPSKVLQEIEAKPLLGHVIERVKQSKLLTQTAVATSENEGNEKIAEIAKKFGVDCCRGSENDVLDRFKTAAKKLNADVIVRITADCPLMDASVLDYVLGEFTAKKADYASNTIQPTYPDGLDVEVFSRAALEKAWTEAKKQSEREHVTPYLWNNPQIFSLVSVKHSKDLSALRWTVDTPSDLEFIREVYKRFKPDSFFSMDDILRLLEKSPEIQKINGDQSRNEAYFKLIEKEKS